MPNSRRGFLKTSALAAVAGAVGECDAVAADEVPATAKDLSPEQFRAKAIECLGGPWPEPCELKPKVTKTEQKEGYRLEWVSYEVEPGDRVPALVLVPDG